MHAEYAVPTQYILCVFLYISLHLRLHPNIFLADLGSRYHIMILCIFIGNHLRGHGKGLIIIGVPMAVLIQQNSCALAYVLGAYLRYGLKIIFKRIPAPIYFRVLII